MAYKTVQNRYRKKPSRYVQVIAALAVLLIGGTLAAVGLYGLAVRPETEATAIQGWLLIHGFIPIPLFIMTSKFWAGILVLLGFLLMPLGMFRLLSPIR